MRKITRNGSKGLPIKALQEHFVNSLGLAVESSSNIAVKPLLVNIKKPYSLKFRVYLFNCGNPPGGRPIDEYKVVLNVDQAYGTRGNFDISNGRFALVVGYVRTYDIFVLWDASKHKNFAYNKNLQVKADTILNAFVNPTSQQQRRTNNGEEIILAARSEYLLQAIMERLNIMYTELLGK